MGVCLISCGVNRYTNSPVPIFKTRLNCDFLERRAELENVTARLVFTGRIDEYFGFGFGRLAEYKYYDMDDVMHKAFADFKRENER